MEEDQEDLNEPMMEGCDDDISVSDLEERDDSSDEECDEHLGSEFDYSTPSQSNMPMLDPPFPDHPPPDSPTPESLPTPTPSPCRQSPSTAQSLQMPTPPPSRQSPSTAQSLQTPTPSPSRQSPSRAHPLPTSWSSTLQPVHIHSFSSHVGPTVTISESPLEIFELFFSDDLVELVVEESNRYSREVMGDERYAKWRKITADETKGSQSLWVWLNCHLLMTVGRGTHCFITHRSRTGYRVRDFVTYHDVCILSRGSPGYDRLGKVRLIINHLLENSVELYDIHKHVAVDEVMIKFQGRSSLKQYMPLKPTKRVINVWVLAGSTNGYFSRFEVYTGKGDSVEKGLGARVVKGLTCALKAITSSLTTFLPAMFSLLTCWRMEFMAVGQLGRI